MSSTDSTLPPVDLFGEPLVERPARRRRAPSLTAPPATSIKPSTDAIPSTTTAWEGALWRRHASAILHVRYMRQRVGEHGGIRLHGIVGWLLTSYTKRRLFALVVLVVGSVGADGTLSTLKNTPAPAGLPPVMQQAPETIPTPAPTKPAAPRKAKQLPPQKTILEYVFPPWVFGK